MLNTQTFYLFHYNYRLNDMEETLDDGGSLFYSFLKGVTYGTDRAAKRARD